MKRSVFYILTVWVLCLATGCRRTASYPPAMQQAESLMNARPDSAIQLLQGMEDTVPMLSEEARMYWHLLGIQACDKLYITHTDDSLINTIVQYYEASDDAAKLMLAYYYQGRVYRDMNDAPRALKAFQQAEDVGCSDYELLTKVYSQKGYLFAYQGLYDEAIAVNKKCMNLYLSNGESKKMTYPLRDIARMFDANGQKDSALYYYKEAYNTVLMNNDSVFYYNLLGELGGFYYENGEKDFARQYLKQSEKHPLIQNKNHIYTLLGRIYFDLNQTDSARFYFQKLLNTDNVRDLYRGYRNMFVVEKKIDQYEKAAEHITKALILRDSLDAINQIEAIAKINSLYNYHHVSEENMILKLKEEKYYNTILRLILLFIIITIIIMLAVYKQKKREQKIIEKERKQKLLAEERYAISQKAICDNEQKISELKVLLEKAKSDNDHLTHELLQAQLKRIKLRNEEILLTQTELNLRISTFMSSDLYIKLRQASNNDTVLIDADTWNKIIEKVDFIYPNFRKHLYDILPDLSDSDKQLCLLSKLGILPAGIARIQNRSRQAVTNARSRIHKKVHYLNIAGANFDDFIDNL